MPDRGEGDARRDFPLDPAPLLFILGSGGFARELRAYLLALMPGRETCLVTHDGVGESIDLRTYRSRVSGRGSDAATYLGSGLCEIKHRMAAEVEGRLALPLVLSSAVWTDRIGDGTVVADGAVLAPGTTIGQSVLVNYSASVGHDTEVGDLSVIAPQAAIGGHCSLGDAVYVGAGALIRERTRIGSGAVIGMGAVVTRDVPAETLVLNVNEVHPLAEWRKAHPAAS